MAKQRTENVPPAALWKDTFSDLMNLLLCCTVKGRNSCKQWGESAE